ncbi:hypothetical protein [Streptomyces sp. HSG2]|uniref:hypothetical protein n=1 Tax=Streptomyces sp. HSG2 TaxID=2797167 RepID=UPI001902C9F0|nr:hypothetical protein [Streptomyces sp. HSG2]
MDIPYETIATICTRRDKPHAGDGDTASGARAGDPRTITRAHARAAGSFGPERHLSDA